MKKKIISIDEALCVGCGNCTTSCEQGAIKIIDGKAKLVNEVFCDGLGKCIGNCPTDALKIIEIEVEEKTKPLACGCPGTMVMDMRACCSSDEASTKAVNSSTSSTECSCVSELKQWPVQLHLVPATASYLKNTELVVLSSCAAVATPEVHSKLIKDRSVVMACPKLDNTQGYLEKLRDIFATAGTPRVIVALMEVPCCSGLLSTVIEALKLSGRKDILLDSVVINLKGNIGDFSRVAY